MIAKLSNTLRPYIGTSQAPGGAPAIAQSFQQPVDAAILGQQDRLETVTIRGLKAADVPVLLNSAESARSDLKKAAIMGGVGAAAVVTAGFLGLPLFHILQAAAIPALHQTAPSLPLVAAAILAPLGFGTMGMGASRALVAGKELLSTQGSWAQETWTREYSGSPTLSKATQTTLTKEGPFGWFMGRQHVKSEVEFRPGSKLTIEHDKINAFPKSVTLVKADGTAKELASGRYLMEMDKNGVSILDPFTGPEADRAQARQTFLAEGTIKLPEGGQYEVNFSSQLLPTSKGLILNPGDLGPWKS